MTSLKDFLEKSGNHIISNEKLIDILETKINNQEEGRFSYLLYNSILIELKLDIEKTIKYWSEDWEKYTRKKLKKCPYCKGKKKCKETCINKDVEKKNMERRLKHIAKQITIRNRDLVRINDILRNYN